MATTFGGPMLESMTVVAEEDRMSLSSRLDALDQVTYRLTFAYRYDAPIQRLRHRLRVMPPPRHGPTTLDASRLTISGAQVRRRRWRDHAGNTVVRLVADHVEEYLEFAYSATLTRRREGASVLLNPHVLGSAAWLRATTLTAASDPLRTLAAVSPPSGHGPFDRLTGLALADALCQVTYDALSYEYGVTGVRTTADQARSRPRRLPGPAHHAGAAGSGLPARYVSGHLVGQGGTHAGRGARAVGRRSRGRGGGVRPCNGRRTGAGHVTVATGRDYRDALRRPATTARPPAA